MDIKDLVKFISSQGCKVKVYKKKKKIDGAFGFFMEDPEPHIKIATKKTKKKKIVSTLIHEYAHFLQWRDGFSKYLDGICWPHQTFQDWVEGYVELTAREIKIFRNVMLTVEHDAEMRAYRLGNELKPDYFDPRYHLCEMQSYMLAIKWAWQERKEWDKRMKSNLFIPKTLTHKELFADITEEEKVLLRLMKPKKKKD